MTRAGVLNALCLVAALALGAASADATRRGYFGAAGAIDGITTVRARSSSSAARSSRVETVRDALGNDVTAGEYRRVVSVSSISDQVLFELIDPSRVIAVTARIQRQGPDAWRYQGRPGIESGGDIEAVLRLHPDLVFVSGFADPRIVETFRQAGIRVFDLGPMHGLPTLQRNVRDIAALLRVPQRGEALVSRVLSGLEAVAADIPDALRVRGLYVGVHGGRIYGGTAGTSYADVLRYGGVVDVAASRGEEGWPAYTAEELLALDPPWILTQSGRERALCATAGLHRLRACREGHVRGVDEVIFTDPGLGMLRAAEAVRVAVYGPR